MTITRNSSTWYGLSTDIKPTNTTGIGSLGVPSTGDTFRETDTGKSFTWTGSAWTALGTPNVVSDSNGNSLTLVPSAAGFQFPITPVPDVLLIDNFNGTTIDTTYRWQTPVTAGTGTMTQSGGNLVTTLGTTASNGAAISSIENFEPSIGAITVGALLQTEASPATNTNRCFGFYTRPGSWTAATPVQDGYVWELDITGSFGASIYAGGVRIFRQAFALTGSTFIPMEISFQGLNALFFLNNFSVPVLTVPVFQPSTLNLPFGFHSINHTSGPASAPTWSTYGIAVVDQSGVQTTQFNGQTISRVRAPGKFIPLNSVSIATETTIWTPAAGRRFRLMGYQLSASAAANIVLKDNTAGTTILVLPSATLGSVLTSPPFGNGILSSAVNNVLTANAGLADTLSGYLFGTEE